MAFLVGASAEHIYSHEGERELAEAIHFHYNAKRSVSERIGNPQFR